MPLRLYADECVDVQFERAAALGRAVLTADYDFVGMVGRRTEAGQRHPGIVFILPRTSIGDAIRAVALVAEVLEQHEIENWIEWVP